MKAFNTFLFLHLVPDLVSGSPAYHRGLGLDDLCGPFQSKLFYGSMISGTQVADLLGKQQKYVFQNNDFSRNQIFTNK